MQEIFNILKQIELNSSRNTKKSILLQNSSNETLKKFLIYANSPRWIYGIGPKSIQRRVPNHVVEKTSDVSQRSLFAKKVVPVTSHETIFQLCDELKKHPFGSNEDVGEVNRFLSECTEDEFYWYSRLLLKDLRMGCTANTINEVYGEIIPVFDVMLAHPYKKFINKIKGMFQLQQKLDGFRFVTFHYPDGKLQFFTRNGVELFNFPEIEEEFKSVETRAVTMVYDGELQANDSFNDTQKLVMRFGDKTGLVYNVFDVITIDEFERQESFDKLFHRYDFLVSTFIDVTSPHIHVVEELYRGDDLTEITKWFAIAKSKGWEGIMIKMNAPYVRKRTSDMLKVKEFDTLDLRVLRINPGNGKHFGRLGSVTVDYKGVEVEVGSGFDDYTRQLLWDSPNMIIDKIIEVQYFEETINEQGRPSLRFPIFKSIRSDK